MPELPEIEHLRRTLEPHVVGARITRVDLRRADMVRLAGSRKPMRGVTSGHLLNGATITEIIRRGKSLAFVAESGRVLASHMGMSGSLCIETGPAKSASADPHVHCVWTLVASSAVSSRLVYRDPRRFGGICPFASVNDLHRDLWSRLGPDALSIDGVTLRERLARTSQPIKAALMNQALVAGVGNIYADEALFAARIHPLARPARITPEQYETLAAAIGSIMRAALESGGSTISDYRDATGQTGAFAFQHNVYGRGGEACVRCGGPLRSLTVGQRTTVCCPKCQPRRPSRGKRT